MIWMVTPDWSDESQQLIAFARLGKCANFNTLRRLVMDGINRLSSMFTQALGLAAMTFKEEQEMNEQKPRKLGDLMLKPSKRDSIGKQIDELNENIRQLNAEWEKMREAAAKLRATIAKSKKLIADWEC